MSSDNKMFELSVNESKTQYRFILPGTEEKPETIYKQIPGKFRLFRSTDGNYQVLSNELFETPEEKGPDNVIPKVFTPKIAND